MLNFRLSTAFDDGDVGHVVRRRYGPAPITIARTPRSHNGRLYRRTAGERERKGSPCRFSELTHVEHSSTHGAAAVRPKMAFLA